MKIKYYISILVCLISAMNEIYADSFEKWGSKSKNGYGYYVRLGYSLGGTAPIPMPEEIRKITTYAPDGGMTFGVDGYKMIDKKWGVLVGARIGFEGMKTKADVKNYHIKITQAGDYLTGYYTGKNENNVSLLGIRVPFEIIYRVSPRWSLRGGPYAHFIIERRFDGGVYDGYLRENTPVGQKVEISSENPASYDFSNEMRRLLWGFEAGADWKMSGRMSLFAQLDWGVNDIFRRDFKTIEFAMYPIFLTVGIALAY